MNTRCLSAIFAAVSIAAVLPSVANATLAADGTAIISDSFPLNYTTEPEFYAHIDYAVYAPGIYKNIPFFLSDKYVYCYQLFDDPGSTSSIMSLDINLGLDASVGLMTYDTASPSGEPGGINPSFFTHDPGQVRYGFFSEPITVNQYSSVLLFTSDSAPDKIMGTGLLNSTTAGSYFVQLPVPAPEPASVLLLALAAPALLRISRQNRK